MWAFVTATTDSGIRINAKATVLGLAKRDVGVDYPLDKKLLKAVFAKTLD
jgi:hypothetical protein